MKGLIVLFLMLAGLAGAQTPLPAKPFSKIWLKTEIVPMNFAWADLGLTRESSFTGPIDEAWEKWFKENLPTTVEEARLCAGDCLRFRREWEEKASGISLGEFAGGVWLQVALNVRKTMDLTDGPKFHWEGRVVLTDIGSRRMMASYTLGPYERTFPGLEGGELNSAFGNQIYRSILSRFKDAALVLEKGLRQNHSSLLKVRGHRNLGDAMELVKLLQTRGTHLGLEAKLQGFGKDGATLLCSYRGEEKSFTDLLSQLKELKSSESYVLEISAEEGVPLIQLKAR